MIGPRALGAIMPRMSPPLAASRPPTRPHYLESPEPLEFPSEAMVPESPMHLELRTLLYQLLCDYLGLGATVGSEQFVYYAADDPRQCLAPDAFVRLSPRTDDTPSWKTWERGAPEVAVEIVSHSDWPELPWLEKLSRYARLGVKEVLRFDPKAPVGKRLRAWDRVNERLAEREVLGDVTPSQILGLTWVVAPAESMAVALRIAVDEAGKEFVASRLEALAAETEALKAEAKARQAAEARVRELEEELKRRG